MGRIILRELIGGIGQFGVEDVAYVPGEMDLGEVTPETSVIIRTYDPQDPSKRPEGGKYFLEVSVMREVIEGLETQLNRSATIEESVKAIRHYAIYDAYIDPEQLKWP